MKKTWAIRKDAEGVSPVIATILMVAITVVLAAVLYVMVLGFGTGGDSTPTAMYSKSSVSVTNGVQINIVSITNSEVPWTEGTVQLTDGTNFAAWNPVTDDLDDGAAITVNYSTDALGSVTVCALVTDVSGNGFVSGSDYLRVYTYGGATAFASATTYTLVLMYEDTGVMIGLGQTFTG